MVTVRISIAKDDCNPYYEYGNFNKKNNPSFIGEYIEMNLPALPRVGDNFWLSEEHSKELAEIITKNGTTEEYNEGWYDYDNKDEDGDPKLVRSIFVSKDSINGETEVIKVQFDSGWDFVWIVIA